MSNPTQAGFRTNRAAAWDESAAWSGLSRSAWVCAVLNHVAAGRHVPRRMRGPGGKRPGPGDDQVVSVLCSDRELKAWKSSAYDVGLTLNRWACLWLNEASGATDIRRQVIKTLR